MYSGTHKWCSLLERDVRQRYRFIRVCNHVLRHTSVSVQPCDILVLAKPHVLGPFATYACVTRVPKHEGSSSLTNLPFARLLSFGTESNDGTNRLMGGNKWGWRLVDTFPDLIAVKGQSLAQQTQGNTGLEQLRDSTETGSMP